MTVQLDVAEYKNWKCINWNVDLDIIRLSVSVLTEDVDEGFFDERGGTYDVKRKIGDVGVIQSLSCNCSGLMYVNLEPWLGISHWEMCLGYTGLSNFIRLFRLL
jgi:hypothetical protein